MVYADQMTESSEQSSKKDQNESEPWLDDLATEDLPCSLIVTNLDNCIFSCLEERAKFEEMFKVIEKEVSFQYFKSFKRARVNYASPLSAAKARIECHQRKFGDSLINCYFAQMIENDNDKNASQFNHLLPPSPVRQFLISPPASPPVGWEPREEGEPIINYDLITALTKLTPGCTHELHPPTDAQPAIVVHVCGDDVEEQSEASMAKTKIQQTRRPPARSSSEGSEDSSDSLVA